MDLTPGTRLGHFEIVAPLGAGGMGEVYRARDARLGRDVAIKILPRHLTDTPEASARFEREARAVASITHPNVCALYDVGHEGETRFLVLELVEGESLRGRLLRGPLPMESVIAFGKEIADALEAAHKRGIVHRDLKPGNIMLGPGDRPKVMDFGLATGVAGAVSGPAGALHGVAGAASVTVTDSSISLTGSRSTVGTISYMSPEQARGERLDARSDLFSLGAVLYEMATGARAFPGATDALVFDAILNKGTPPIRERRPDAPAELERIVEKALEKDRALRYQTAADLRGDLARLERDLGSGKAAASGGAGRARARAVPRAALVVAALAALAAAGWAGWRGLRGDGDFWKPNHAVQITSFEAGFDAVLSPDGQWLAGLSGPDAAIYNIATRDVRIVDPAGTSGRRCLQVAWRPDGKAIVSVDTDSSRDVTVSTIDIMSGRREVLARLGRPPTDVLLSLRADLSPDGRLLATLRASSGQSAEDLDELWVIDLPSGREQRLVSVPEGSTIVPPVWNAEGTRIAYVTRRSVTDASLETVDLRGNRSIVIDDPRGQLLSSGADFVTFTWLPGSRILYGWRLSPVTRESDWALKVVRVDERSGRPIGTPTHFFTVSSAQPVYPSVSANADRIAFGAYRAKRTVELVGANGHSPSVALSAAMRTGQAWPVWSRDGGRIFTRKSRDATGWDVFSIDLARGRVDPLVASDSTEWPLCLTPDGGELLVQQEKRLLAVPVAGGSTRTIMEHFEGEVRCGAAADTPCILIEGQGTELIVRDFNPATGPGAERFRHPMDGPVSPMTLFIPDLTRDGRRIAVFQYPVPKGLVLDAVTGRILRRIVLPDSFLVQEVAWSGDGEALYATGMYNPGGYWAGRLSDTGIAEYLHQSDDTWVGTPSVSPDGKTIALTSIEFRDEVWMVERPGKALRP